MTEVAKGLYSFFSSFGLEAYTEYGIPKDASLPYITYQLAQPDWMDSVPIYARVWYRSTTWAEITAKVDQISAAIGLGTTIPTDSGFLMLNKGTPWAQEMPMEGDDTLKVVYLNITLNAFIA